jgi:hypothetical protein
VSEVYKTTVRVKSGKQRKVIATAKVEKAKNLDRFDKEADIREKRIGIVFKVIYVIAVAFAAVFTIIAESYARGLTDTYILFACADGFMLCLLIYMLVYIFNELKCLKLNSEALSETQHKRTEDAYSFVFTYFSWGSITAIACGLVVGYYQTEIPKEWYGYAVIIGTMIAAVLGNQFDKKIERIGSLISSIMWTVVAIAVLIGMAVK